MFELIFHPIKCIYFLLALSRIICYSRQHTFDKKISLERKKKRNEKNM